MPPYSTIAPEAIDSLMYYASRAPEGAVVEIGVYKGGSAWHLAKLGRPLFLYDTFEGMPFQGPDDGGNPAGKFSDTCIEDVQALVPNATLVKGVFPESLVDMPAIGFVHADADQYQSTQAILDTMPKRMVKGGFILFDDFMVPGCEGCTKAIIESPYRVLAVMETGKALLIV